MREKDTIKFENIAEVNLYNYASQIIVRLETINVKELYVDCNSQEQFSCWIEDVSINNNKISKHTVIKKMNLPEKVENDSLERTENVLPEGTKPKCLQEKKNNIAMIFFRRVTIITVLLSLVTMFFYKNRNTCFSNSKKKKKPFLKTYFIVAFFLVGISICVFLIKKEYNKKLF